MHVIQFFVNTANGSDVKPEKSGLGRMGLSLGLGLKGRSLGFGAVT
jgi:hypothetical protein